MKTYIFIVLGLFFLPIPHVDGQSENNLSSLQHLQEVTASDYCFFLNQLTPADSYDLYEEKMGSDFLTASLVRKGPPGNYHYYVISGKETAPIYDVSDVDKKMYLAFSSNDIEENSDTENFIRSNNENFFILQKTEETLSLAKKNSPVSCFEYKSPSKYLLALIPFALMVTDDFFELTSSSTPPVEESETIHRQTEDNVALGSEPPFFGENRFEDYLLVACPDVNLKERIKAASRQVISTSEKNDLLASKLFHSTLSHRLYLKAGPAENSINTFAAFFAHQSSIDLQHCMFIRNRFLKSCDLAEQYSLKQKLQRLLNDSQRWTDAANDLVRYNDLKEQTINEGKEGVEGRVYDAAIAMMKDSIQCLTKAKIYRSSLMQTKNASLKEFINNAIEYALSASRLYIDAAHEIEREMDASAHRSLSTRAYEASMKADNLLIEEYSH